MTSDLVSRLAAPVPRYTSYPTANHFSDAVTSEHVKGWLAALPSEGALSLYLHIPFCRELCFYCGCTTKAVRRYAPVETYLASLMVEIARVAALVPRGQRVTHIHWGGGSPDILSPDDIVRLGGALREHFRVSPDVEVAVEIDPRLLTEQQADSFADIGVNRVSVGVQDFDPEVQAAIGRVQSFETTRRAVELFRARGVRSLNVDLVYGLPHQTTERALRTLEDVLALQPDRIAVFGYAHLPARLKHQRLIDDAWLPGAAERFAQSRGIAERLGGNGYVEIGIDHFARPSDALARAPVVRNFQGYTTDRADALLGLGASAISRLPQGFAQNAVAIADYARSIERGDLATARGHRMQGDDEMRAYVIDRLMCAFSVSWHDLRRRFDERARRLISEAEDAVSRDGDGLAYLRDDGLFITDAGRPFVRNVCAWFDPYLSRDIQQRLHALSI